MPNVLETQELTVGLWDKLRLLLKVHSLEVAQKPLGGMLTQQVLRGLFKHVAEGRFRNDQLDVGLEVGALEQHVLAVVL